MISRKSAYPQGPSHVFGRIGTGAFEAARVLRASLWGLLALAGDLIVRRRFDCHAKRKIELSNSAAVRPEALDELILG